MATIQNRLLALKKKQFLTTTDLSVLLNANRSTVLSWEKGVKPSPGKVPLIEEKLITIEKVSKAFPGLFPVPLSITQYQRKTYLLDTLNVRLPKPGATARR